MKRITSLLLYICAPLWASDFTLKVKVSGISSKEGHLRLLVFNQKKGFPNQYTNAYRVLSQKRTSSSIQEFTIQGLPKGTYAITALHDVNSNEKLDTNWIGIPKEPVGVSSYSPKMKPSWKKAQFELTKNQTISIELKQF